MAVRAVRGAIQLDRDEREHLLESAQELVRAVLGPTASTIDDLISILFTATPDLHSEFPALAARELGLGDVPLICAHEIDVAGAMPRVLRLMAHVETDRARADIRTCTCAARWLCAATWPSEAPGVTLPEPGRPAGLPGAVRIVGTGLLGTSLGLALRRRGVDVEASPTPRRPPWPSRSTWGPVSVARATPRSRSSWWLRRPTWWPTWSPPSWPRTRQPG